AQNAARLEHPNIVAIHEVGTAAELHFYSMHLVRGQTLAGKLQHDGTLEAKAAAALMLPIARAIDYAHHLSVLHLDLKPANVLIDGDGVPHVADFGLARRMERELALANDEISGTPSYMAPEQATSGLEKISPATDVWGLGAILYELLSGQPPFLGATPQATIELVRNATPRPIRSLLPKLPVDLAAIVDKCLTRKPTQRYATSAALATDLQAFLAGKPVSARPLNPVQRLGHWVRRERTLAIGALVIVALAIGIVVATMRQSAQPAVSGKSIAVLPFENLSKDKDNDYFVAGMQDLILTKLADIGDIKVISRTSTEKYKSHPDNLKTIAEQLGVANILEGSVQKAANQVLINVQLINARTDEHVWAQAYTRTLDNIFGVDGEVAEQIATALKAKLSPAETANLAAVPTQNRPAYDLFLRAEYQSNKGLVNYDTASWKAAIPLYQQAVGQDPNFALALARLSYNESQLAWFGGGGLEVKQINQQARADAERALQLQPKLSAAHLAIGFSDYWGRGDYAAALQAFAAALKLKPNDADTLAAQAFVERRQGRFDDAIASLAKAQTLDPRNSALAFELGSTYMNVSRYADAEDAFQHALALDPGNRNAKSYNANAILYSSGDIPRALAAAQGDEPALKSVRVNLLTDQRKYSEALALLDSIPDTPDNFSFPGGGLKSEQMADLYYWDMGDKARALTLYQEALPKVRAQLEVQQGINLAFVWESIGDAELGLGHTAQGLDAIAEAQAIVDRSGDHNYGPLIMVTSAGKYANARRPDLAVPLLAKALAAPGIGSYYSPVLLWLDPTWDPIRKDAGFLALLKRYAKDRPATASSEVKP
ncbi:MAG: protein kinase domain-containing protein, partial [Rudaea sp.]